MWMMEEYFVRPEKTKYFVVKDLGNMETFFGCKIFDIKTNDTIYIHQPKLLKHLSRKLDNG
jgi:hypothetical protein